MPVNYSPEAKAARLQAAVTLIDAGSGPGRLEICTAGYAVVLASIALSDPSATVVGDTMTFTGFPRADTAADATGTPVVARVVDSTGKVVIDGLTVGVDESAEIMLGSATITEGLEVQINSAIITHG